MNSLNLHPKLSVTSDCRHSNYMRPKPSSRILERESGPQYGSTHTAIDELKQATLQGTSSSRSLKSLPCRTICSLLRPMHATHNSLKFVSVGGSVRVRSFRTSKHSSAQWLVTLVIRLSSTNKGFSTCQQEEMSILLDDAADAPSASIAAYGFCSASPSNMSLTFVDS